MRALMNSWSGSPLKVTTSRPRGPSRRCADRRAPPRAAFLHDQLDAREKGRVASDHRFDRGHYQSSLRSRPIRYRRSRGQKMKRLTIIERVVLTVVLIW